MRALIGHTGFVGGNLRAQAQFDAFYNSSNIEEIAGQRFELLVCAGAPGLKWKANQEPEADREAIRRLLAPLSWVWATRFVLISTVDVFCDPVGVDEETQATPSTPYGQHRRALERWCGMRQDALNLRLPALFGPGLKKNAIYDLMHGHRLEHLNPDAVFQFYDLRRLWDDVQIALASGLPRVHLVTEPIRLGDVAREVFGVTLAERPGEDPPRYDVRTRHADLWRRTGPYLQDRAEVVAALRDFVS